MIIFAYLFWTLLQIGLIQNESKVYYKLERNVKHDTDIQELENKWKHFLVLFEAYYKLAWYKTYKSSLFVVNT